MTVSTTGAPHRPVSPAKASTSKAAICLKKAGSGTNTEYKSGSDPLLWYEFRSGTATDRAMLLRLRNSRYRGVLLYPQAWALLGDLEGSRLQPILQVDDLAVWNSMLNEGVVTSFIAAHPDQIAVASEDEEVLEQAQKSGLGRCYRVAVNDATSLESGIERGKTYDFLMIRFRDPTNIPLELVIATLQSTKTVLVKEIASNRDIDDAVVSLGVMEVGADGLLFSPIGEDFDVFLQRLADTETEQLQLSVGEVVESRSIGMGVRSCLDLTTLFDNDEGMIVGSTSSGGVFCCPEVFFLPYMELRPFRVNAGAVHSYVYNSGDRTDYMTELRAGSAVMVVGKDGKTRRATVGRVKTETRPLRLIAVRFESGSEVNVIMQDDWHVRVYSHDARPLNITELKPGDRVLGYEARPGRHVGIRVDERIVEN